VSAFKWNGLYACLCLHGVALDLTQLGDSGRGNSLAFYFLYYIKLVSIQALQYFSLVDKKKTF